MTLFRRLGSRGAKPNPDAFWSDKWGWMDEVLGERLDRFCIEHQNRVWSGDNCTFTDSMKHHRLWEPGFQPCRVVPVLVVRIDGETP